MSILKTIPHHQFISSIFLVLACGMLASCSQQNKSQETLSKFAVQPAENIIQAEQFDLQDVRLLNSPFKAAMERDGNYLMSLDPDRLLAPYFEEAGLNPEAEHYGGWESTGLDGHSLGHYLTACAMMYAAGGGDQFRERVDQIVTGIEEAQNAIGTGYVGGVPNGQQIF